MKHTLTLLALTAALLLGSCRDKTSSASQAEGADNEALALADIHPGKKLMETNCYLCHSPSAPENEGRIGPPMAAIKAYYLAEDPTLEQFTQEMLAFLNQPSAEKAKMKEAVARYGLMPYQQYSEENIRQIAAFIYEYQIEEPDWFPAHWEAQHGGTYQQRGKLVEAAADAPKSLEELGLEYALGTKEVLGKNLMGALQSKGALHALEFCNTRALPLTDSMSRHYGADIRRVSDQPRNPDNRANAEELEYIAQFKKQIAAGEEPRPVVLEKAGIAQFYYPIVTNTMCLQCHGKKDALQPELLRKLANLYPADQAVGYAENEVRGIWSVRMKKGE